MRYSFWHSPDKHKMASIKPWLMQGIVLEITPIAHDPACTGRELGGGENVVA